MDTSNLSNANIERIKKQLANGMELKFCYADNASSSKVVVNINGENQTIQLNKQNIPNGFSLKSSTVTAAEDDTYNDVIDRFSKNNGFDFVKGIDYEDNPAKVVLGESMFVNFEFKILDSSVLFLGTVKMRIQNATWAQKKIDKVALGLSNFSKALVVAVQTYVVKGENVFVNNRFGVDTVATIEKILTDNKKVLSPFDVADICGGAITSYNIIDHSDNSIAIVVNVKTQGNKYYRLPLIISGTAKLPTF